MNRIMSKIYLVVHIGLVLCLAAFNILGTGILKNCLQCENERKANMEVIPVMEILNKTFDRKQENTKKIAYLTFDDGPSDNTDRILDILKEKGVKASFFVVGKTGEKAEKRYQRIVKEGHTLGLHSYSHKYDEIYADLENFKEDIRRLRDYLFEVTGEKPWAYRFPGGSSNRVARMEIRECIEFLKKEGIVHFDWNASSEDAVATGVSCSTLNSNVLKDALRFQHPMILMHDLQECNGTVEGLGSLIDSLLEAGYEIGPITRNTKPVQHVK